LKWLAISYDKAQQQKYVFLAVKISSCQKLWYHDEGLNIWKQKTYFYVQSLYYKENKCILKA